jgi:hypothetical protein
MRFSYCMVPEVYQLFWAALARGEFITDAAVEAGTYRKQGRWLVAAGGGSPAPRPWLEGRLAGSYRQRGGGRRRLWFAAPSVAGFRGAIVMDSICW